MSDLTPHRASYMNPPKHGRFRKGQSGNPNGRPKRIDDPFTTLEKVLARRVSIAGEDRKIPIREALFRRLRERALAGDKRALTLQQKILKLAAAASPTPENSADIIGAKIRLAKMAGIELDLDEYETGPGS
jgi:hypothetical protein